MRKDIVVVDILVLKTTCHHWDDIFIGCLLVCCEISAELS
jgi:hypothetical protein